MNQDSNDSNDPFLTNLEARFDRLEQIIDEGFADLNRKADYILALIENAIERSEIRQKYALTSRSRVILEQTKKHP